MGELGYIRASDNIWKISDCGGKPVQVTHHSSGNLFFPKHVRRTARRSCYEENFGLWKLDVATGKSSEIRIDIKSDPKESESERRVSLMRRRVSSSPSMRRPRLRRMARSSPLPPSRRGGARDAYAVARGRSAVVAGREVDRVCFGSYRPSGNLDRRRMAVASSGSSDADCDKAFDRLGARSKSLLWSGSDHQLRRVEIASGKTEVVASSDVATIGAPQSRPTARGFRIRNEIRCCGITSISRPRAEARNG